MKPIDSFQNRLQKIMTIRNMKQVELVEKTKIDKTLINKYLSGVSKAKQDKLTILGNALNVNEVWLMGYDVAMDRNLKTDKLGNFVVTIPLLGEVKVGYNHLAKESWIGTEDISPELAKTGEFYALKVKGNSMADSILDGDIAIVKKQDIFEDGKISVVIINGDEGTLKLVKILDNGIKLVPLNRRINPETNEPYFEDMFFTKEDIDKKPVLMAGKLVDLKRHYD